MKAVKVEDGLDAIREEHSKLCHLVQLVGDAFSPWLMIVCFSCLAMTILVSYELINNYTSEEYGITTEEILGPVLLLVMRLWLLCKSAHKPQEKNDEIRSILAGIPGRFLDDRTRLQLIHFNTQLTESKATVSAGGYFDVNKGLVLALLGTFCSYVIILGELGRQYPPAAKQT